MRFFVTGIAGFIGSHLADALLADGHDVVGIDNLSGGDPANVPKGAKWFVEDCRRLGEFSGIDVVVHCAALAHEGLSIFSPKLITDNVYGASVSVFSAAIASGVKKIVFFSSMARYGEQTFPFTEDMRCRPVDPYGVAKVAAEQTLRILCQAHDVAFSIVVPHSVYGERQAIDPFRNVVTIFINRLLRGYPPVIYGDGQQVRSFSYIGDVVPSVVRLATDIEEGNGEVFNVGPDEEYVSINELWRLLAPMCGIELEEPIFLPPRPLEVKFATCSSNKARERLGYRTQTRLETGLRRMVDDIKRRGPRPFDYKLPIEIDSPFIPSTWKEKSL